MNWLVLLYFLELGYSPFYDSFNVLDAENIKVETESVYYITFDAEIVLFDYIFVGGSIKTYMQSQDINYSFVPFEANYMFKAGLRYKNIEAGFNHWCGHGVSPYPQTYEPRGTTDANYEEFYIKISNNY